MKRMIFISVLFAVFAEPSVFAAGFEKSIPWGGQASGVAGIGTPYMQGSQAVFYNPAGLAGDKVGQDVSVNVSPTQGKYKVTIGNASVNSNDKTLFPFGVMYGNTLNDKLGVGAGVYVAGGNLADFTTASGMNIKTDLQIMEFALGVGYKVMDNLKLGASWRVGMVNGSLSGPTPSAPSIESDYTSLKDTNYLGFKLGAQYKLTDKLNLGFTYRSEMNYKAKGSVSAASTTQDASLATVFPPAWTLGFSHQCTDTWKFMGEYALTEYHRNGELTIVRGNVTGAQTLNWNDQTSVRLGAEYGGMSLPIRFGYVWTSQVTNADYATPTMTPPGTANGVTLGTGMTMDSLHVDGGLEYLMVDGTPTGQTDKNSLVGYALHLGASYNF